MVFTVEPVNDVVDPGFHTEARRHGDRGAREPRGNATIVFWFNGLIHLRFCGRLRLCDAKLTLAMFLRVRGRFASFLKANSATHACPTTGKAGFATPSKEKWTPATSSCSKVIFAVVATRASQVGQ